MSPTEVIKKGSYGVIILAAGSSSRLGRPKQLLKYQHQTLLNNSIQAALASEANEIIVVLGANAAAIKNEIGGLNISIITNKDWQEGMASSIRSGINAMIQINPAAEGVLIMVCDQPYVTPALLNKLLATHIQTRKEIIPCIYENIFGTPVLFHCSLLPELLQLSGDMGAKNLIRQHANKIAAVPFPEGKTDIDTEQDYQQLSNEKGFKISE